MKSEGNEDYCVNKTNIWTNISLIFVFLLSYILCKWLFREKERPKTKLKEEDTFRKSTEDFFN